MRTLLLGMGNPILSDDAVGVRLARDFRARFQRLESAADLVVIEECSLGGINLLDIIAGYERLIVLDSIQTREGVPGDWRYFTAEALRETMNLSNIHDTNFATALELGRRLGQDIPPESEIHIFAIEVQDVITFSETMTPPLEAAYPAISEAIFQKALQLIVSN